MFQAEPALLPPLYSFSACSRKWLVVLDVAVAVVAVRDRSGHRERERRDAHDGRRAQMRLITFPLSRSAGGSADLAPSARQPQSLHLRHGTQARNRRLRRPRRLDGVRRRERSGGRPAPRQLVLRARLALHHHARRHRREVRRRRRHGRVRDPAGARGRRRARRPRRDRDPRLGARPRPRGPDRRRGGRGRRRRVRLDLRDRRGGQRRRPAAAGGRAGRDRDRAVRAPADDRDRRARGDRPARAEGLRRAALAWRLVSLRDERRPRPVRSRRASSAATSSSSCSRTRSRA